MDQSEHKTGHFGPFGGQYVPETLMPALEELEQAFNYCWADTHFRNEFDKYLRDYVGRPSPLYYAERLTRHCGGARIYLKREDLNHTGAHKINNTLGQALLAKYMNKPRVIAETGAGMHGVATATVAARLGLECDVYMGREDIHRQAPNVRRMEYLGANVLPVDTGSGTLKDALNEALRDWVGSVQRTSYVLGTVAGPHPYPLMVRAFQRVIGDETYEQIARHENDLPAAIIACVGGGSNASGIFQAFQQESQVKLIGVEAGGSGLETGKHAASIGGGRLGVLHGSKSYVLQDDYGQIKPTHSASAGLDYPGVGPEHAYLHEMQKAEYTVVNDQEAVDNFDLLCRLEGIIPALESAHAVAEAVRRAPRMRPDEYLIVNLSGRGDKDMSAVDEFRNAQKKEDANSE